ISSTEIDFTPGALPPGPCDVEVHYTGNLGSGTLAGGYTVDGGTTPTIVPGAASITEGNSGTKTLNIPVTLSAASAQTVTAHWGTVQINAGNEHEAKPGADYVAVSGIVTFAPGQTTATVPVTVNGDVLDEYDELFLVAFTNPTNATIGGFYGLGFGQITDDDALPTIVPDFGAPSVAEGSTDSVVP